MNPQKNERGFTLIEVIAAITILSILMISIFQFLPQAMSYSKDNENKTLALYVGNGVMNYMRNQEYHIIEAFYEDKKTKGIVALSEKNDEDMCSLTYKVGTSADYKLFSDIEVCRSIFQPTLNNNTYSENIHVFITDDVTQAYINSLQEYFSTNELKVNSNDLANIQREKTSGYLRYIVFVDLNLEDKRNGILLEGSIRNE